jgi:hypothetical protein
MYDDGQHEFLFLNMHDYQLCEGGAPKEQPAAVSDAGLHLAGARAACGAVHSRFLAAP